MKAFTIKCMYKHILSHMNDICLTYSFQVKVAGECGNVTD